MNGDLRLLVQSIEIFFDVFNNYIVPLLKSWWWVPWPFVLAKPAWDQWIRWRQLKAFREREYILLEFKLPEDIRKPMKAMADVFTAMYMVALEHSPSATREKWIEGATVDYPTFSLEIVSFGGDAHLYIRVEEHLRNSVEAIFHSQYPHLEIKEVEDYTEKVPQDVPNEDWDIWGYDWELVDIDAMPIKTYEDFETGTEPKEEKRIDPLARLLEGFTHLKEGEQVWVQFNLTDAGGDWRDEGRKEMNKIMQKDTEERKPTPILVRFFRILLFGDVEYDKGEKEEKTALVEFQLTPEEKYRAELIGKKVAEQGFKTGVRMVYIGPREAFFKPHVSIPISYVSSYGRGAQYLKPITRTRTKVKSLVEVFGFDKRRLYLRKRRMFRNYRWRVNPDFPAKTGTCVLVPSELAALYHFPGREAAPAPSLERIKAKRGEAPPGLPTEE